MQIWHPFILFQTLFFRQIFFATYRLRCRATTLNDLNDWLMPIFKSYFQENYAKLPGFLINTKVNTNQYKSIQKWQFFFFQYFSTDSCLAHQTYPEKPFRQKICHTTENLEKKAFKRHKIVFFYLKLLYS
jgi:hypothetical protein